MDYKIKYLKYKNKYLQEKDLHGGMKEGSSSADTSKHGSSSVQDGIPEIGIDGLTDDNIHACVNAWFDNYDSFIEKNKGHKNLSKFDVKKVTNMKGLFKNKIFETDEKYYIETWDVSNVTNMSCMFMNTNFNEDITQWLEKIRECEPKIKNVFGIYYVIRNKMFEKCTNCDSYNNIFKIEDSPLTIIRNNILHKYTSIDIDLDNWLDEDDNDESTDANIDNKVYNGSIKDLVKNLSEYESNYIFLDEKIKDYLVSLKNENLLKELDPLRAYKLKTSENNIICDQTEIQTIINTLLPEKERPKFEDTQSWIVYLKRVIKSMEMTNIKIRDCVTVWNKDEDECIKKYGHIKHWDTSKVTNMTGLFKNSNKDYEIGNWDVSNVTDMSEMFMNTTIFTGKGLKNWDVSKVENMYRMFSNSVQFNEDIEFWIPSSVKNISYMFSKCKIFNKDLSIWRRRINNYDEIHREYVFSKDYYTNKTDKGDEINVLSSQTDGKRRDNKLKKLKHDLYDDDAALLRRTRKMLQCKNEACTKNGRQFDKDELFGDCVDDDELARNIKSLQNNGVKSCTRKGKIK
jgi:hypothetical protein